MALINSGLSIIRAVKEAGFGEIVILFCNNWGLSTERIHDAVPLGYINPKLLDMHTNCGLPGEIHQTLQGLSKKK